MSWTGIKSRFLSAKEAFERKVAIIIPERVHPNHLTAFRLSIILALPVAAWYQVDPRKIFLLVAVAGISDALDGITARQRHQITPLGTFMDPVADKLFVTVCFLVLWHWHLMSVELIFWMLALESHLFVIPVLSFAWRLLGGSVEARSYYIRPNFFGKIKMIMLISGVCLMLLGHAYNWQALIYTGRTIIYIGLVLGGMALILYILDWAHKKY